LHLIQPWKKLAKTKFEAGEYALAESYLTKVLYRSEAVPGTQFEGRAETLQMLVLALSRQGKWIETHRSLQQSFDGKEETMEKIATEARAKGEWQEAERILIQLWNHPATEPRDHNIQIQRRLRLLYALAEVAFGKKDYGRAETCAIRPTER